VKPAFSVVAGCDHTCALLQNGDVKCWGLNNFGQLGIGNKVNQSTPASVVVGKASGLLAAGNSEFYACALLTGGSVKCWGYNSSGQLGLGDTTSRGTSASQMGDNLPFVLLTP